MLDVAQVITEAGFDIWDDLVHGFGGAYLPPIVRTRGNRGRPTPTISNTRMAPCWWCSRT
jgi:hypothetical protein